MKKPRQDKTADQLVHELIRDLMVRNAVSRHEMARAMVRGAHDLELMSTKAEKAAAGIFMHELADHLLRGGRGFYLFRGDLEAPIGTDPVSRAGRSIATAEEEPGRVACIMALDLLKAGWRRDDVARGLVAALAMSLSSHREKQPPSDSG